MPASSDAKQLFIHRADLITVLLIFTIIIIFFFLAFGSLTTALSIPQHSHSDNKGRLLLLY